MEDTRGIRIFSLIEIFYAGKSIKRIEGTAEREFVVKQGIAAWILVASGGGGLLLFLFFTYALFRCGFFKRKTKQELKQLKRKTQMMHEQFDFSNLMTPNPMFYTDDDNDNSE